MKSVTAATASVAGEATPGGSSVRPDVCIIQQIGAVIRGGCDVEQRGWGMEILEDGMRRDWINHIGK